MREYLFRGKSVETGEWVIGNGFFVDDGVPGKPVRIFNGRYWTKVIKETVGEFTGIALKGVKVFEGGILKTVWANNVWIHEVEWNDGCFFVDDAYIDEYEKDNSDYSEVIGNVHDNPELLETSE